MNCVAALAVAALRHRLIVSYVEMLNFAIVVVQLCGPPSPPFPAYFRAVTGATFSLLFATAGLFCSCRAQ